jgi:hypothetical protein
VASVVLNVSILANGWSLLLVPIVSWLLVLPNVLLATSLCGSGSCSGIFNGHEVHIFLFLFLLFLIVLLSNLNFFCLGRWSNFLLALFPFFFSCFVDCSTNEIGNLADLFVGVVERMEEFAVATI